VHDPVSSGGLKRRRSSARIARERGIRFPRIHLHESIRRRREKRFAQQFSRRVHAAQLNDERNKTTRTSGIQATPLCSADGRKTARANARRSVPQARGSAKRKRRSGIVRGRPDRVEIISSSNRREHRRDLAPDSASQPACAEGEMKTSREALGRDELPVPHSAEARTGRELTIEPVVTGLPAVPEVAD